MEEHLAGSSTARAARWTSPTAGSAITKHWAAPSAIGDAIGGGIEILAGSATVSDSTISGPAYRGGQQQQSARPERGHRLEAGTLVVRNTVVGNNQAIGGDDCGDDSFLGSALGGALTTNGLTSFADSTISDNLSRRASTRPITTPKAAVLKSNLQPPPSQAATSAAIRPSATAQCGPYAGAAAGGAVAN